MKAYLVYVKGMSGRVSPQIWYDPPPHGYTGIEVVAGPFLIPTRMLYGHDGCKRHLDTVAADMNYLFKRAA